MARRLKRKGWQGIQTIWHVVCVIKSAFLTGRNTTKCLGLPLMVVAGLGCARVQTSSDVLSRKDAEMQPQAVEKLCGYKSFAALMDEARKAVTFLQTQPDFQPTFWVDAKSREYFTIEKMVAENQALIKARPHSHVSTNCVVRNHYAHFATRALDS